MKTFRLAKAISVGVLSLGLTAIPFSISASAQDATSPDDTPGVGAVEDIEFDWGWLGLLGLLGLAGLAGRNRSDARHQQHDYRTDVPASSSTGLPPSSQANIPANPQADAPRYRDPYRDPK